ncbi:antibiotic biosynthesis monooxygenase [Novosphingobium flavum]|jgi:quinol monooxygenase YgiN|uniref:Antibiotic biosynthesis monooxygenase n=1 Tax=Novosphingobium aerophilum TaxID=2839843 RepID=A0A7X1F7E5_9SPHN|nr:putative quinol monooxygenase [Novosphingobium aerophilum]MBC2651419.1 antibiotic biosynthesis monooxygenase [Novosphingobium aerophilum]MBC2663316.1 antibiotic biosynthesis monooxygenase [Novosphingobium aerophilum]
MLLLIGHLRFPSEARAGVLAALAEVTHATRAEPGCLFYDFAEDVLEPDLFRVSEGWHDADALRGHWASAHMERFRTAREALGMSERVVTLYETAGPTEI